MTPLPVITNCDACGACCLHLGTPPGYAAFFPADLADAEAGRRRAMPEDRETFDRLPAAARRELADYYAAVRRGEVADRTRNDDTPCLWYDAEAHRCRWHDFRPLVCREFEVGGEDCLRLRDECLAP